MERNKHLLIFSVWTGVLSLFCATVAHAQRSDTALRGGVLSQTGAPLSGVTVTVRSSVDDNTQTTATNDDGQFSFGNLNVGVRYDVLFSLLGYESHVESDFLLRTRPDNVLTVTLTEVASNLDEVVVVGYGTQRRGNVTGAVSNIVAEDLRTTTHSSLAQSLQGKMPGLQIRQQTGEPGDFSTMINIRGYGTPLYVIDGIPRDGASEFQKLNPEDIESISILKDASAAIYGLNAANGVVIVTTKKGTPGRARFTYSHVSGLQFPTGMPKMTNAAQYMEMLNEATINGGGTPILPKEELEKYRQGLPGYESTDWYDETFRSYSSQAEDNLSAQGGSEAMSYFLSFGFQNDNGLLRSKDMNYRRYTFRSNFTARLAKNLSADLFLSGRADRRNKPGTDFFTIFKQTRTSLPIERVYANDNPNYPALVLPLDNPVLLADKNYTGYDDTRNKSFQSSISFTYTTPFVKGLELKATAAYDSNNELVKYLGKSYQVYSYDKEDDVYLPFEKNNPARISNTNRDFNRVNFQLQAGYDTLFATGHRIGATAVYEQRETWFRSSFLQREYEFYTNDQIDQASQNNQTNRGNENETANISYIGRFNYAFKDKYLFEVAARYDGSYRYHPDRRWGFFPVVSGGWVISEERFMKDHMPIITHLKVRGSYGVIGEDAGAPFQYVQAFSATGGRGYEFIDGTYLNGAASPSIVNEYLTWFQSRTQNIGLDVALFRGRLAFEADVFRRDRTGLLAYRNVSVPNTFGGTLPQENLNSDRTQGFDLAVSHRNTINKVSYGISGNLSFSRTMNNYVERAPFRSSWDRWRNGAEDRWNDLIWAYTVEGQFQNQEEIYTAPLQNGNLGNARELPGDFRYQDVNGDGIIDNRDMLPLFRNGQPKYYYGLVLDAEWKGFDVNVVVQGAGNYTLRFGQTYAGVFNFNGNSPEFFFDRWHQEDPYNPNSEWIPGVWPATRFDPDRGAISNESKVWRKEATYLRLKSIMIGYTVNSPFIRKAGVRNIRVYTNAHNLFTLADRFVKPFDPEKIEGDYSGGYTYPLTMSFNLGVNVTF